MIEGVSVGVGSTGLGYNSENFEYTLFEILATHPNIGGTLGTVRYNLSDVIPTGSIPGNFISATSSGKIIAESQFPIFDIELSEIKYYHFKYIDGVIVSNTGYTGCGGFEIYCKNEIAGDLWAKIFKSGKKYDIKPIGLAARDSLRIEMGYCLYGNEIDENRCPYEAGLAWITKPETNS